MMQVGTWEIISSIFIVCFKFKFKLVLCHCAETMSIDSTLPSPSSLSSSSMGFEGVPGRRRKKRTSIETNVRVALERSFMTVRQTKVIF